jgi:hypothetical protein
MGSASRAAKTSGAPSAARVRRPCSAAPMARRGSVTGLRAMSCRRFREGPDIQQRALAEPVISASRGTDTVRRNASNSPSSGSTSGRFASAPASMYAFARSIAAPVLRRRGRRYGPHREGIRVATGVDGHPGAAGRLRAGDEEGLAVEVAAAPGVDLVLQMEPGRSGVFHEPDGARGVQRLAEAGGAGRRPGRASATPGSPSMTVPPPRVITARPPRAGAAGRGRGSGGSTPGPPRW